MDSVSERKVYRHAMEPYKETIADFIDAYGEGNIDYYGESLKILQESVKNQSNVLKKNLPPGLKWDFGNFNSITGKGVKNIFKKYIKKHILSGN